MSRITIVGFACLASGCASLPDVTYQYYGAQASTSVSLIRTVACDRESRLIEVHAPLVVTTYSADPNKKAELKLARLRGTFADSDVSIAWYEDGRLKSINQSSTGRGETVLKGAVGIAAAAAGGPMGGGTPVQRTAECAVVDLLGQGKPITLTYRPEKPGGQADHAPGSGQLPQYELLVPSDEYDQQVHDRLQTKLKKLYVRRGVDKQNVQRASFTPAEGTTADHVAIRLYHTRTVTYAFYAVPAGDNAQPGEPFARRSTIVPAEESYDLPIPRPALFGKQGFKLEVAESGAVSASGYVSESGAAGVIGVLGSVQEATRARTVSEQAAEAQAEADLIAQQQRLARCRAMAATCI